MVRMCACPGTEHVKQLQPGEVLSQLAMWLYYGSVSGQGSTLVYTEIFKQLLDGFPWTFAQMVIVQRGQVLLTSCSATNRSGLTSSSRSQYVLEYVDLC